MNSGFFCRTCGAHHAEMPMDFGADAPASYYSIPESERERRCDLTPELCMIDEREFFVRGGLEIPVTDGERPFTWGVWTSLSERSFRRMAELWETEGRESEPPFFGWLCTSLPLYPETLSLKSLVHMRSIRLRPLIELEPTDHSLAMDQRLGITMARVQEMVEQLLHAGDELT